LKSAKIPTHIGDLLHLEIMKRFLILLILIAFNTSTFASSDCFTFPATSQEMHADKGPQLLARIEQAVVNIPETTSDTLNAIPMEKMVLLRTNSDLEKTLGVIAKRKNATLPFVFWTKLEESLFTSLEMETREYVKEVEEVYKLFRIQFNYDVFMETFKLIKKPKKANLAKRKIIAELERMSFFLSQIYQKEIDLLNPAHLLEFFGVSKRVELGQALQEIAKKNLALNGRISSLLSEEGSSSDLGEQAWTLLRKHFNMERNTRFHRSYQAFYENKFSFETIRDLIEKLHLPTNVEAQYLKQLKDIIASESLESHGKKRASTLLMYKAYFEVFPESEVTFGVFKPTQSLEYQQFLMMQSGINQRSRLIERTNIKLDHIIDQVERIEASVSGLNDKVKGLAEEYPNIANQMEDAIKDLPIEDLIDLSEDQLKLLTRNIRSAEKQVDELLEAEVERLGIESIKRFSALNYNWKRVRPDHPYRLVGTDYKSVVFHKDVVDFFKHQEDIGDRFLAALSKSYVPHVNASGLRALTKIHPEFRDIKLLRKGGKIRIYGRLVGDTIHFFGIHAKDEAYKNAQMAKTIESFRIDSI
jgi:hypothetical protein